ncbi:MAG TPA: flavodoxin [Coriobacteriia bacterium]|nr:flavodoxin [Coriobacteriia bacterium]
MSDSTCLIVFYSRKGQHFVSGDIVDLPIGNTEVAAKMIEATTGGDLLHLETVKEYPATYDKTTKVARKELRRNARPRIKDQQVSIDGYDTVFLGYPNWWGTAPMAVFTFLESHDFTGKTIIPFCTQEGSGLGHSEDEIRMACPGAEVLGGLAIRGGSVQGAEMTIRRWIEASTRVF